MNLMCYASELNQCFRDILVNAVQAIRDAERKDILEKGKGKITLITENIKPKDVIRVTIRDNGVGIPEENINKVFDPFFTTREVGAGKGLGLSEAYGIVQKHNGEIEIKSKEKEGTEIVITLPIV